jgi:L-rhamnose isomerase
MHLLLQIGQNVNEKLFIYILGIQTIKQDTISQKDLVLFCSNLIPESINFLINYNLRYNLNILDSVVYNYLKPLLFINNEIILCIIYHKKLLLHISGITKDIDEVILKDNNFDLIYTYPSIEIQIYKDVLNKYSDKILTYKNKMLYHTDYTYAI